MKRRHATAAAAATVLAAAQLAGCGMVTGYSQPYPLEPSPQPMPLQARPAPGAIFADGHEVALFEDVRAKRVGDILTIVLRESTSASKSTSTSTNKDSEISLPGPVIAGRPVTANGTEILDTSITGNRQFAGAGSASQSNQLAGNITVTVVQRLANGNLVVQGQKWLRLNHGDEFVQIVGIVRPFDVRTDNSITSDRVADARISYGGRGVIANANQPGWLDRFFNSPVMPY
ncbi:MAG: flagellar basal body L-ring protein FlgH [Steroidobacteraceae bacterium]|nr:flagellar basal body L-ring protein FlgH [Steroidobacteraceae bacterium]